MRISYAVFCLHRDLHVLTHSFPTRRSSDLILNDLLPVSLIMAERKLEGVFNFCNPGAISHNEILDLYKQYIDPEFTYSNFTIEEQDKILKAKRSNNELVRSLTAIASDRKSTRLNSSH